MIVDHREVLIEWLKVQISEAQGSLEKDWGKVPERNYWDGYLDSLKGVLKKLEERIQK